MKIRKANKKDLKEIAKLMKKELAKPPFNERDSSSYILKSLNFYIKIGKIYAVKEKNEIIGVIIFKREQYWEGPVIIIEDLAVNKKFQKLNIGKTLMDYVESLAKKEKVNAICFKTNKKSRAVKFYQKSGYCLDKNSVFMIKNLNYKQKKK
ncbi:hypothetical protein A3K73_08300 [Candidatus Pacearchaeota archaeon RBG_13_36_9]|nr:MAG: hypothetical protein A3K73_08300 [Candidatus Pacearchaeota archaeon RBG_13_36_9]